MDQNDTQNNDHSVGVISTESAGLVEQQDRRTSMAEEEEESHLHPFEHQDILTAMENDSDKPANEQDLVDMKTKASKNADSVLETDAKMKALRVIPPTKVQGPTSFEEPSLCAASDGGNDTRNMKHRQAKGLQHIQPSNAPSGIAVATEVVDSPEETERMATQIADIQAKLQEHETRDIVHGTPVTFTQEAADGQRDENRSVHRYLRILFILLMVGGVVVLILTLKKKSPPGQIATTSSPSLVASTSMSRSPAPTPTPTPTHTSALTANPTQASSMPSLPPSWTSQPTTDAPSATPTLSRRSYLLEALMPSVSTTSGVFDTIEDWETYLIANPDTPQSEAFGWLSNVDEYSARPQTMSVAELQERYALLVLYFATAGPYWETSGAYFLNSTSSVCAWNGGEEQLIDSSWVLFPEGVFCDDDGGVSEIHMPSCGIWGEIPAELSLLRSLVYLQLRENQLTGHLPSTLPSSLTSIDLSGNYLSGTLPSTLPVSSSSIDLSNNFLSGTLPGEWGNSIPKIIQLTLYFNDLNGSILPLEWGALNQLEFLDIGSNEFSGYISTTIGLMIGLTSLNLESAGILLTGGLPSELGKLEHLLELWASGLGSSLPSEIGNLGSLSFLDVYSSTGFIPTEIGLMTSMEEIRFESNRFSGTLPSEIGLLSNLRNLFLGNNPRITGTVPTEFGNLSNLNTIDLSITSITGSIDALFCDGIGNPQDVHVECYYEDYEYFFQNISSTEIECSCCDIASSCY